jgi:hypothetical protein
MCSFASAGYIVGGTMLNCSLRSEVGADCEVWHVKVHGVFSGLVLTGPPYVKGGYFLASFSGLTGPGDFSGGGIVISAGAAIPFGGTVGKIKLGSKWSNGWISGEAGWDLGIDVVTGSTWVTSFDVGDCRSGCEFY